MLSSSRGDAPKTFIYFEWLPAFQDILKLSDSAVTFEQQLITL